MPEKTLKEKVDLARGFLAQIAQTFLDEYHAAKETPIKGFWQMKYADVEIVQEALTALEERVAELEKERALVADWYEDEFCGEFERFVCVLKEQDAFRKEAPDDGK